MGQGGVGWGCWVRVGRCPQVAGRKLIAAFHRGTLISGFLLSIHLGKAGMFGSRKKTDQCKKNSD